MQIAFVGDKDYSCSESEKELFNVGTGGEESEEEKKRIETQEERRRNRWKRAKKDPDALD